MGLGGVWWRGWILEEVKIKDLIEIEKFRWKISRFLSFKDFHGSQVLQIHKFRDFKEDFLIFKLFNLYYLSNETLVL